MQKRWSEPSFARFEIATMMGFYSIRKLIEANKLTTKATDTLISMVFYPTLGKPVTRFNNHRVDELYDLDAPRPTNLNLTKVCHQFIHSYVFVPVFNKRNRLSIILIASDYQRSKALLAIEVKTVIGVFEKISRDEVRSSHSVFDDSTGDYRIKNYSTSSFRGQKDAPMVFKSAPRRVPQVSILRPGKAQHSTRLPPTR
ncbi:MAG: hypothetical protein P4K86_08265 [Terracidiphilus sp.]|nr:hypothetical protein [Terracidiphilus sp.]MDR3776532.1 hypothetical protein [Terracidiphilus sp.]